MEYDILHVEVHHVNGHRGRKIFYRDGTDGRTKVASTICCVSGNPLSTNYTGAIRYCRRFGQFHHAVLVLISKIVKIQIKADKTEADYQKWSALQKRIDIMAGKEDAES